MASPSHSSSTVEALRCPHCGGALRPLGTHALLASTDVPRHGSRLEVTATPANALHVVSLGCELGHVTFTLDPERSL